MLKFRTGKFSYNSICTKIVQDDIFSLQMFFVYIYTFFIRKERASMEAFGRDCYIRDYHVYGYHVYKKIWREAIGEEL